MRILTVNIPESYIEVMDLLANEEGSDSDDRMYCSRSELIRIAVRDFLIDELKKLKKEPFKMETNEEQPEDNIIRIRKKDASGNYTEEYETHKIIAILETNEQKKEEKPININIKLELPKPKPKPIDNIFWEDKTTNLRISKVNPDMAFIEGYGYVQKFNDPQFQ